MISRLLVVVLLSVAPAFGQWKATRTFRGPGAPAANLCADAYDLGIVYTDYGKGGKTYTCHITASGVYEWQAVISSDPRGTAAVPGTLIVASLNNRTALRNWNAQTARITAAVPSSQAVVVYLGDSWTSQNNLTDPLRMELQGALGNAGQGYAQLDDQAAPPATITRASTGTWASSTASVMPGANGNSTTSTDAATPASKTITAVANAFVIHYVKKPDGAQFRWKVDSGGWTTVDTANASTVFASATASGYTTGTHTLTIEVVNPLSSVAGVTLLGVDCQTTDNGVRFHRIGHPGATAATFSGLNAAMWQAAVAALNPTLVVLTFGVNEALTNVSPDTHVANLTALVSRIVEAVPTADIVLAPPTDIGQATKYVISEYVEAQRAYAVHVGVGFVDSAASMGAYTGANASGLYANATHVNVAGGALIASKMREFLLDAVVPYRGTNIALGQNAGLAQGGTANVAIGQDAQKAAAATTGVVAVGASALSANTGNSNTAVGYQALKLNTTGVQATAVGYRALAANTTGQNNTAMGWYALGTAAPGHNNTAVGYNALTNTTNASNTAVGVNSLASASSGGSNTALGNGAGYGPNPGTNATTTGSNNTFLGALTAPGSTTQRSYMTVVGAGATGLCDNCVVLGRASDGYVFGGVQVADAGLQNSQCTIYLASNTSARVRCKGSDGTVREAALTLN